MVDELASSKPHEWPIRVLGPESLPDIQALFQVAFGGVMDASVYHWKYAGGRGVSMGMHAPGANGQPALVAHYGGVWLPVQVGNGPSCEVHTVFQGTDAMVSPSVRDVFARFGPFGRLTRAFINGQVVPNGPAWYGLGFPNRRHELLGERLGLYRAFEPVHEWVWNLTAASGALPAAVGGEVLAFDWSDASHRAELSALAVAHAQVQSGCWRMVRSVDGWRHRFANHPVVRYQVWLVRQQGRVVLALVTRQLDHTRLEVMDWMVASTSDVSHLPAALVTVGIRSGVEWLQGWATEVALAGWEGALSGVVRQEGCVMVVNNPVIAGRQSADWQGRVWVTGGDTDFR